MRSYLFIFKLITKPGLAMERETRFYSYAVALYGYSLCVFRTGELYQYIGRWSDSGALDPGGLKKRAVFQYVSFFLLRV